MGYRISELADRSGFPASTLRYYETVGLLPTPGRTEAGYRVYDDEAVERLRFIGRAKAMGLSLDDIADLVGLWADGPCSMLHGRLLALLDGKVDEVRGRVAELASFAAQLDHVRATLDATEPAARCGPGCGCDGELPAAPATPAACTLSSDDAADRSTAWAELLGHAVERHRTPAGIRVRLPDDPAVVARAADLAVREVGCCAFFSFSLTVEAGGVWLEVTAPASDGQAVLDSLFGPVTTGA